MISSTAAGLLWGLAYIQAKYERRPRFALVLFLAGIALIVVDVWVGQVDGGGLR